MVRGNDQSNLELSRMSTFELSGKLFGLDISNLNEVIRLTQYTPIPNSNGIYHGVFNLRGEIYPLVDISTVLELAPKKIRPEDMVLIVNYNDVLLGILVDKIQSILSYDPKNIKISRGIVSKSLSKYIQGILDYKDKIIHILDMDSLFRAQNLLAYF